MTTATRRRRAIVPQHPNWFRVIRRFRVAGGPVQAECIAETSTATPAVLIASDEPGAAVVTRWDSRRVFDNGKPIEDRPADAGE